MGHKTLISGTSYNVNGGKVLIGGTAYGIKKGRTLVGGAGYDISFGTPLSVVQIGGSVYMNVNGVATEFLVVHQGNPNTSLYDGSCNGIWLLAKNLFDKQRWAKNYGNNAYGKSSIHTYLNNTLLPMFDAGVQSLVKTVKIPYVNGDGPTGPVASGSNGLTTKCFLLSGRELGFNNSYLPIDGAKLDYFDAGESYNGPDVTKRIAYYNGKASVWPLRSPSTGTDYQIWTVGTNGKSNRSAGSDNSYCFRPALILPHDTAIDDANNIIA